MRKKSGQMIEWKDSITISSEWFQRNSGQASEEYQNFPKMFL